MGFMTFIYVLFALWLCAVFLASWFVLYIVFSLIESSWKGLRK